MENGGDKWRNYDKELESNIAILASEFTLIQTILTDLLEYFRPSPYIKLVKA